MGWTTCRRRRKGLLLRTRLTRVIESLRGYLRRHPLTVGYLGALLGVWLLMRFVLADAAVRDLHQVLGASLANLHEHPVLAVAGSAFVVRTGIGPGELALTVGIGLVLCLGCLEGASGSRRAAGVLLAGHLGASVVTAVALILGQQPAGVRSTVEFGIGYVAFTAAGAATWLFPVLLRFPWLAVVLLYPVIDGDWYLGALDYPALGRISAASIGAVAGYLVLRPQFAH